jgi:hypothetical protein
MLEPRQLLAGAGIFANDQDIGAPAQPGSIAYTNGTYTVVGGGADIGGNSDQFNFAYNSFAGDGSVVADVTAIANTDGSAKAGVMFRNSTSPTAAFAGVFITPTSGIVMLVRSSDGGTAGGTTLPGFIAPRFLRLSRLGSQVSGFRSNDGITWSQVGSFAVSFGASPLAGLAVTSRNNSTTTTGTFTNASILPDGWSDNDVGAPAFPGSAVYDPAGNTFTLTGSGADIGGSADQFNFASRSMTGDGSVIARIDSLTDTNPLAKAGVMIRDSFSAGAMFASALLTAENGLMFEWRSTTGAAVSFTSVASVAAPIWLKLSDLGNSFSAYYCSDAVSWNQIGASQTIAMSSATTLAGLAGTSHTNAALTSANFSGASIVQGGWTDSDLGAPALGGSATYDTPSNTYTLIGAGADIGGTSDQFNFASRTMSGDGSVVAYVNSLSNTDPSAKAGVMLRATSAVDSAFAGIFITPQNGAIFEWRTTSGAAAMQQSISPAAAPVSLKLTRSGNSFVASYSTDGINFSPIGSAQSIAMPSNVLAGVAVASHNNAALCTAKFTGVGIGTNLPPGAGVYSAADELFLNDLENREVQFFFNETNANTGLVPDGALANGGSNGSACSIASLGFGLTALTIGDERGWLTHSAAYQRALTTVNFLYNNAAQVQGFYYHFLSTTTGARSGNSELSSIDTAELMAGVLNVAQYWAGTQAAQVATNIFNRVNWPFMQKPNGQFYGAWAPENGGQFSGGYVDFSEAVLLYLLGLGSPTHPTARTSWNSWSRTPVVTYGSYTFITATDSALFTVQYPQAWFDMRGLTDTAGLNYYPNAQTATLAQRQWSADHNSTWSDYTLNMWGLTASDSASGYTVWGAPPAFGPINGTVVPTAPGGSLAFVPRQAIDALKNMYTLYGTTNYRKYGFVDAFNPLTNWTSSIVLGIDVGMTLIAAENSRSNFVWNDFGQSPVAGQSLASAFPMLTPSLQSAVSRKTDASFMVSDIPVNLGAGDVAVENRQGGPTQLVLTFGANVIKGPNFNISLSSGSVSSSSTSGSTLTINVSGVADAQTLVINVTDVRHFSTAASGNYSFSLGVLLADANQDRSVDTIDFNILAANFGGTGKESSQGDFNDDGAVDTVDFNLLASNFGKTIAASSAFSTPVAVRPDALSTVRVSMNAAPTSKDDKLLDILS